LRTQRKLATRRALQEAALFLFAEQGYEETSLVQIANLAGVSVRTFTVHFPTKEDVLFTSAQEGFADLGNLVTTAPAALSDVEAVELAVVARAQGRSYDPVEQRLTELLVRAADTSSVVRGKQAEYVNQIRETLIGAIAQRHHELRPTTATVLSAEIATRTFHLAVVEWASTRRDTMVPIVHRWFATLRSVAADSARLRTD
jgi:AcrR family transcriptional regulator